MLLLIKSHASGCNFDKSNIHQWVFFTFFGLYKWYPSAKRMANVYLSVANFTKTIPNKKPGVYVYRKKYLNSWGGLSAQLSVYKV